MPKILYALAYAVFVITPVSKGLVYMYFLYRTDLLTTVTGPWLLCSTVNCLFILAFWWPNVVKEVIATELASLQDEYRWEEERLKAEIN